MCFLSRLSYLGNVWLFVIVLNIWTNLTWITNIFLFRMTNKLLYFTLLLSNSRTISFSHMRKHVSSSTNHWGLHCRTMQDLVLFSFGHYKNTREMFYTIDFGDMKSAAQFIGISNASTTNPSGWDVCEIVKHHSITEVISCQCSLMRLCLFTSFPTPLSVMCARICTTWMPVFW